MHDRAVIAAHRAARRSLAAVAALLCFSAHLFRNQRCRCAFIPP